MEFDYDNAGNLISQEIASADVTYIYDAWNRLVRMKYGSSDRSKYRYNGLNWRIEKFADTSMPPDGDLNQRRKMYYSANWQLLEERVDDDALAQDPPPEINRHMQYVWGPRYIDDIVARRQNSDFENDDPDVTYEDVWYHLTDAQFSTVAIIDENAMVIERVSYDAYGRARHHRGADLDGDGDVDISDYFLLDGNRGEYGLGDVDRNGIVNVLDQLQLFEQWGDALEPGQLSITDNIIGYAGYVFNAELHGGGLYTVRFRVYSPDLGRWLTRDPLGYVDGMNTYQYGASSPLRFTDSTGLRSEVHIACRNVRDPRVQGYNHCAIFACCTESQTCVRYEILGDNPDGSGRKGKVSGHYPPFQGSDEVLYETEPINDECARQRGSWDSDESPCALAACIGRAFDNINMPQYKPILGPNSNTFAHQLINYCHLRFKSFTERRKRHLRSNLLGDTVIEVEVTISQPERAWGWKGGFGCPPASVTRDCPPRPAPPSPIKAPLRAL